MLHCLLQVGRPPEARCPCPGQLPSGALAPRSHWGENGRRRSLWRLLDLLPWAGWRLAESVQRGLASAWGPLRAAVAVMPSGDFGFLPCDILRVGFDGESAGPDGQGHQGLSERSQAVGAVLSLLLVALTGCLLALLLHKKERR